MPSGEPRLPHPERLALVQGRETADLIQAVRANLVVRDGFASFYFHPFLDLDLLERTVEGIEAAGDTFVDPRTL